MGQYLANCPSEYKPVPYRRYVDDTFCLLRNRDHIHSFLEFINRQHPNIKFTYELESDYALPFLDVLVTHDDNTFSTSLYRKKIFTGLYTDFSSLAPTKYKINLQSFTKIMRLHPLPPQSMLVGLAMGSFDVNFQGKHCLQSQH